jgi:hypothetical protein
MVTFIAAAIDIVRLTEVGERRDEFPDERGLKLELWHDWASRKTL